VSTSFLFLFLSSSIINGVKDMDGFRDTMNISRVQSDVNVTNGSSNCAGSDENENALLGLIVSLFSVGCFIGALLSGGFSDLVGRKYTIILGSGIFFIGGAIQGGSFFLWMVLVGRMIAGIGVGVLSMIVPVYNAELSPKSLRGKLVALNQLFITAGIMISFCVSLAFAGIDFGWRIALGLQCILATILILGMIFLPETPR
jgi:MFS family permease